ncbi:MAG: TonB-dependent receptor [Paucibacter sp.]|nr:TonB-dependent receptor [Roseateles sp.]
MSYKNSPRQASIQVAFKGFRRTPVASAVGGVLLALSGALHAQQAAGDDAAVSPQLERVVISANKRIERLEDVPMSISVVDDKALDRNNVVNFSDLQALSPALSITYGSVPSNNSLNMRGIGTISTGIGVEADVAVVIDDIPIGMQVQALQGLADVSRIEILKGPQSTLFGKNSVSGAINITTKPITGSMSYTAGTLFTSDNEWRVTATAGGRTSENFGFRVAVTANDFPGVVHDLSQNTHTDGSGSTTIGAKLDWNLTKDLDVMLFPHYNHSVNRCCVTPYTAVTNINTATVQFTPVTASTALSGINVGPANADVREAAFSGATSDDSGLGMKVTYNAPSGYVLSSITSVDKYSQSDQQQDGPVVDLPLLAYGTLANGQPSGVNLPVTQGGTTGVKAYTQEFRLASPDESSFRYVTGLWFAKNDIDRHFMRGYGGIVGKTQGLPPKEFFGHVTNTTEAVYGQSTWDFMPSNSLITGLRVNRQVSGYDINIGATPPPLAFASIGEYQKSGVVDTSITGRVGLEHHFNADVMTYMAVSTGHKGNGYNLSSGLTAGQAQLNPVKPEKSTNYEIGFKGNLLNNRATVSVTAFQEYFKDYQQSTYTIIPGTATGQVVLDSIGGVQSHGLEVDGTYLASANLMLTGSAAYTVATVSDWPGGGSAGKLNYNGFTMPNAPRKKLNVGAQYDIPLLNQSFNGFVGANYRFQSMVFQNMNGIASGVQDTSQTQGAYGIFNLSAGIKAKSGAYKFSGFVNNLFNQHYSYSNVPSAGGFTGGTASTWLPARDAFRYFGVRFDAKF